jgi:aldehyde:ferredoxin oxidoreductase
MSWQNRVLRVNLTTGACAPEPLNRAWAEQFLGQRGLATKYLYEEVDPTVDPYDPANKIIYATGPLTGTFASTGGRYSVVTKGALTGTVAASNSGGRFGAALKHAGYDLLIVEGRADAPVWLEIVNDEVTLHDAAAYWGRSVWETETALRESHPEPEVSVASIGRAGELGVRFACVINDMSRAAGRSGVGAVMGSKQLKAILVRGTRGVRVADPAGFMQAVYAARALLDGSAHQKHFASAGTLGMMNNTQGFGSMPTRNARDVQFEGHVKINSEAVTRPRASDGKPNLLTNKACFACTIACGRVATIDPQHFSLLGEGRDRYQHASGGLEYENAFALGAMCGVDDVDAVTFANFVCDEHGMDTISLGGSIAAAMELYEVGAISEREIGMPLPFGSAEGLVAMAEATALGTGFGADIGLGARRLCEKYGRPELAMAVKGQEIPGYDPRGMQGIALSYATSNRGACHTRGTPFVDDFVNVTPEGKPEIVRTQQNLVAAYDSSGLCGFTRGIFKLDGLAAQLTPATGSEWSVERLQTLGERVWNLERLFNLGAGFTRADDTLPARFLEEPAKSGTATGWVAKLDQMLPQYYALRGWNTDGVPEPETLQRLDLA